MPDVLGNFGIYEIGNVWTCRRITGTPMSSRVGLQICGGFCRKENYRCSVCRFIFTKYISLNSITVPKYIFQQNDQQIWQQEKPTKATVSLLHQPWFMFDTVPRLQEIYCYIVLYSCSTCCTESERRKPNRCSINLLQLLALQAWRWLFIRIINYWFGHFKKQRLNARDAAQMYGIDKLAS